METRRPFLTAEWRNLAMLNFEIEPARLAPWVPAGTELDLYDGKAFVSVVGFLFDKVSVCGVGVPGHRRFPEVNLRFYVRRTVAGEVRRGVVFIKEIVPRRLVATVARRVYGENYVTLPMRHSIDIPHTAQASLGSAEYAWRHAGRWERLALTHASDWQLPAAGSPAEFIVEHYWGYTKHPSGRTFEYRVTHPRWRVADARETTWDCNVRSLYGPAFAAALEAPSSAFVADGSPVAVYRGTEIGTSAANRTTLRCNLHQDNGTAA